MLSTMSAVRDSEVDAFLANRLVSCEFHGFPAGLAGARQKLLMPETLINGDCSAF